MKTFKILIAICLITFSLSVLMAEQEDIVVTAIGEAAGTGLAAKEKSVEDALRKAVEKGFGVYIDSATLTQNASLISDDVVAETRGFVRSYDILEQFEQDGIFSTKIEAEVSLEKIWESESLNLLLKRMGVPRFAIIAMEDHEGTPVTNSAALHKTTELLVEKGFTLVNASNVQQLHPDEINNAFLNIQSAVDIGKKADAEIIVLISASGAFEGEKKVYGTKLRIFKGNCGVKVVQVDSKKIIASSVQSGNGGSVEEAIISAAEDNSELFIKQILNAWSKNLNMGRVIQLEIANVSVSELMKIVEILQTLEGVSSVEQRNFSNKKAELEVKSKHKTMYLAENLENLPDFNFEIQSFSSNKIVVLKK